MKGYTAKVGMRKPQPSSGLMRVIDGAFMQFAPRQKFPEPTPDFDPEAALEASRRYLEQYGWWRV